MRDPIAQSVKQTLLAQARRNELLIAFTRVVLSIAALALNGAFVVLGTSSGVSMPAIIHLPIAAYAAVSLAFAVAMQRGWYRLGAARVFQVVDGVVFVTVTYTVVRSVGVDTANAWGMMPESAAICTLLAASTGLRLDTVGTIIGSVTALGAFVACAVLLGFGAWETSYVASVVLAGGFLGLWMTRIVERAARVEVEKAIMRRFLPQHLEVGSESLESLVAQPKRLDATTASGSPSTPGSAGTSRSTRDPRRQAAPKRRGLRPSTSTACPRRSFRSRPPQRRTASTNRVSPAMERDAFWWSPSSTTRASTDSSWWAKSLPASAAAPAAAELVEAPDRRHSRRAHPTTDAAAECRGTRSRRPHGG